MRYPDCESNLIEFKQEIPKNDQIIKTIIGFCNTNGGKLIIGVADDRNILGLSDTEIEEAMEFIDQSIFEACSPHVIPRLYIQRIGEKSVLVVEVSEGMNKPYFRRSEGLEKGTYIRLGRHTVRATEEIIQELQWQSRGIDFECLPVFQARMEDIDEAAVQTFFENRKHSTKIAPNEQVLKSYNIIAFDQSKKYPSVLGILLFGRNTQQYFSEAMIICTHFKGVSGREAIAALDCEGTLFNQFSQAFHFVTSRLHHSFSIKHLKRDEQLEIPEEAIREALLNMVVHRNYHMKSPSKIAIYDDRIEFFSPGQFPGPIVIEKIQSGISYLRNPAICKILREAKYIEKLGSGFITIFTSYRQKHLLPPKVIEGENYVKCILPREADISASQDISDQGKIKDLFSAAEEVTAQEVSQKLSISKATATRRLNVMIDGGLIERIGETKNVRYRLKTT